MARPNYSFKKRQKELKRQKKKEEKLLRRQAKKDGNLDETVAGGEGEAVVPADGDGVDIAAAPEDQSPTPDSD